MHSQTITLMPGEELRVICGAADTSNKSTDSTPNIPKRFGRWEGGKKTRKSKTTGGGKTRKVSGYFQFMQEERSNIVKQHPNFAVTDVAKEAGKRWRSLSAAEKAKY